MAGLLRGLEATATIVSTLGTWNGAPDIARNDVAHMMASFREQLSTIRDVVLEISETAGEAVAVRTTRMTAAR